MVNRNEFADDRAMDNNNHNLSVHTPAWIAQVWISFALSASAMLVGIFYLDASAWARAFLAAMTLLVINSSLALAKTVRDVHEDQRLLRRVDDARVTKLITEVDPLAL